MSDENLTVILLCILLGVIACVQPVAECHSKAHALGYQCTWGLFSGCVLEKPDGKKVLLEQLRDFDN